MKAYKYLLPLAAACLSLMPAKAQLLEKSKPFMIGYENTKLSEDESGVEYKSRFGVALSKRRTYYVGPSLFKLLRFGIDATWMDLSYAQFEKGKGVGGVFDGMMGTINSGSYDDMNDYFDNAYDNAINGDGGEGSDDLLDRVSLGKHRIAFNVGVGPSVRVAPFSLLGNKVLNKLKVGAYFHWNPGYQALLFTGDGVEVSHGALLRNFGIGVNISFARVGIGVEHRWGSSKLKNWQFESDDEGDEVMPGEPGYETEEPDEQSKHLRYNHSTTRFYIGIRF